MRGARKDYALMALGVVLLIVGSYWGLAVAPTEQFMGDVQRIMYVHVPTAWNAIALSRNEQASLVQPGVWSFG